MADLSATADPMDAAATEAAAMMQALSNPARLRILCALVEGPICVGELVTRIGARQAYVSGELLKLREKGFVTATRDGRQMTYALADDRLRPLLDCLYALFCAQDNAP